MFIHSRPWILALFLGALIPYAHAQGPLLPPAGPAPTMRTLQQIEPRTPISGLPYAITQPGSYYLETNLAAAVGSNGITISTNDVTLDLLGFTLAGATNSAYGIGVVGIRRNMVIRNGVIRGFGIGVDASGADNSRYQDLRVVLNRGDGLRIGQYAVLEGCLVMENAGDGLQGYQGTVVRNCVVSSNSLNGILLGPDSLAADCLVADNGQAGLVAGANSTVERCQVLRSGTRGVVLHRDSAVRQCTVQNAGQEGIIATNHNNVIEQNRVTGSGIGLALRGHGNVVTGNLVQDNSDNYEFVATNSLDLLITRIPEFIDWPARVQLLGDLYGSGGLIINSDHVTVDLNGFALIGRSSGSPGINVPTTVHNLHVRNGSLRNWVGPGLDAHDAHNGVLEGVSAHQNGDHGLAVGNGWTVSRCTAEDNGGHGFVVGDGGTVDHCAALNNTGAGFSVGFGSTVDSCAARDNQQNGFLVGGHAIVRHCTASQNTSNGFQVSSLSLVEHNNATMNSDDGIRVTGERSRIDSNHVGQNDTGIRAGNTAIRNLFIRNSASANLTIDYAISTNNAIGQYLAAAVPETITNANPWANFLY